MSSGFQVARFIRVAGGWLLHESRWEVAGPGTGLVVVRVCFGFRVYFEGRANIQIDCHAVYVGSKKRNSRMSPTFLVVHWEQ